MASGVNVSVAVHHHVKAVITAVTADVGTGNDGVNDQRLRPVIRTDVEAIAVLTPELVADLNGVSAAALDLVSNRRREGQRTLSGVHFELARGTQFESGNPLNRNGYGRWVSPRRYGENLLHVVVKGLQAEGHALADIRDTDTLKCGKFRAPFFRVVATEIAHLNGSRVGPFRR